MPGFIYLLLVRKVAKWWAWTIDDIVWSHHWIAGGIHQDFTGDFQICLQDFMVDDDIDIPVSQHGLRYIKIEVEVAERDRVVSGISAYFHFRDFSGDQHYARD